MWSGQQHDPFLLRKQSHTPGSAEKEAKWHEKHLEMEKAAVLCKVIPPPNSFPGLLTLLHTCGRYLCHTFSPAFIL